MSGQIVTPFYDNYFLGSQAIYGPGWSSYRVAPFEGHSYNELGFDMLSEMREAVAITGTNQFKFKLSQDSCRSYKLSCDDRDIKTLTELTEVPEIAQTLEDPRFKWYHIWARTMSLNNVFQTEFTEEVIASEYAEMYEWAVYMLTTYANTNKVFFVGAWEGDWSLMWASGCKSSSGYDFSCVPNDQVIDSYIKWSIVRQESIRDAKRDYPTEGVDIFHYIEFNLATENFAEHPNIPGKLRPTILNSVVPAVNPDFLSYSSYKSTNIYNQHRRPKFDQGAADEALWEILDYAESKLSTTDTDFSMMGDMKRREFSLSATNTDVTVVNGRTKRVFIGEFGVLRTNQEATFERTICQIARAALEWGCPFILQWEAYDNDSNTQALVTRGTEDLNTLGTIRQLYKAWHDAAKAYVSDANPSAEDFRAWAVEWFSNH